MVRALRLGGAAVAAAWLLAVAAFAAAPDLEVLQLRDNFFLIAGAGGHISVQVGDDGVVVVDAGSAARSDEVVATIKKITPRPIRYVINTHHHGDHSGGNVKMQQLNAQIVASEEARQNMVDGKQPGLPTIAIEHHAHIYLSGKNAELYHFGRAHTNGDVVVLFPAHRTLAAGDMFTFGDATPQLIDYAGGGSAKEWTGTLDSVLQLDFDTVVPGHGNVTTKRDMAKFRDSTLTLRNRIHEMIVQKKSRDDIAQMLRKEFHWEQLHLDRGLDGALAELR